MFLTAMGKCIQNTQREKQRRGEGEREAKKERERENSGTYTCSHIDPHTHRSGKTDVLRLY